MAASFKSYVDNQVTELLAGIDDELCVATYDYYYAAAQADPEDQLAKDVCSIITDRREPSRELRDTLSKSFGLTDPVGSEIDELSPPLQKRFDDLQKTADDFKKIAEDAVGQIETLSKRVQSIEDTPLPRAPRNVAFKEGDNQFFGKAVTSEEEKVAVLQDLLKTHGPDALATMMIKASHATGGHKLTLKE